MAASAAAIVKAESGSQQAAQHPCGFFVYLHALGQQVSGRLITDLVQQREDTARCTHDRFLALHYANLIWKQNTAEIMATADTDPAVYAAVVAFAEATGLVPIELKKEQAGYILNSLLVPFLMAGVRLWMEGVADPHTIDTAWRIGSGVPAGPFQILDIIGLTTPYNILSCSDDLAAQATAKVIKEQYIDKGKLGIVSGEGFYTY